MANKESLGGTRRDEKGRRVDSKNRLLRVGEQQRKDGCYMFSYLNPVTGKREFVYSWKLERHDKMPAGKRPDISLREKEKQIERDLFDNITPKGNNYTVLQLVELYIETKTKVRKTTSGGYKTCVNFLKKDPMGSKRIDTVSIADAKKWLVKLQADGMGYSSIKSKRGVLRPAFQLAADSDWIRKNPFDFELKDLLIDDSVKRYALTEREERLYLNFIKNDEHYKQYYDGMFLLFKLGLRVSEFCGLTKKDIDFKNRLINIDHQLQYTGGSGAYIEHNTKTDAGVRKLPMDDEVYECLKRVIKNRPKPKIEPIIDGYGGFLFLNKYNRPTLAYYWEKKFAYSIAKYNSIYKEELRKFSCHHARHTRITRWIKQGLSVKTVQYLAGHSDITTTLNCYTHFYYEDVLEDINKTKKAEQLLSELNGISGSDSKKELMEVLKGVINQ